VNRETTIVVTWFSPWSRLR